MVLAFVGRLMFVLIFFGSAFEKFSSYDVSTGGPTTAYMAPKMDNFLSQVKAHTGVELPIDKGLYPTLILVAGAMEAIGGLLFLANSKLGSLLLLAFVVPTTVIMHDFWTAPNEKVHLLEMVQFMKNLALAGALVMHLASSTRTARTVKSKRE